MKRQRAWPDLPLLKSEPLTRDALHSADAVLIVTDHAAVDYDFVLEHSRLVVDTRGRYRGRHPKVVKA
jgi:UDP-N-acetyl-D-glucosamine dehydrogenase